MVNNRSCQSTTPLLYVLCFLVLLNGGAVYAQTSVNWYIPFQKEGLWGYMNSAKEVVVEPRFSNAYFFRDRVFEGDTVARGRVKIEDKYGIIDQTGRWIAQPLYDSILVDYIITSESIYSYAECQGQRIFISLDGQETDKPVGVGSWYCAMGYGDDCLFAKKQAPEEKSAEIWLIETSSGYRQIIGHRWEEDNQVKQKRDTLDFYIDTIITVGNVRIISDGRDSMIVINEFSIAKRGAMIRPATPVGCNEVRFFQHLKIIANCNYHIGAYRVGDLWGLIDLNPDQRSENSLVMLSPRYKSVVAQVHGFFLVEYEDNKWGYIGINEGTLREYW